MKLTVTGRHLVVTESTREQIARRIRRLDRLLSDRAVSAQCVMSREPQGISCDLTVHVGGGHALHGLGRDARVATAVGLAVEKVAQQATRLTDRQRTKRRPEPRSVAEPPPEPTRAPPRPRVIRAHGYDLKPMSLDDAMLALDGSDRTFLVFRLATSERMAILYRRPDGHFGLVEPEA
jgi:putative sigma-54 modulation protein